MENLGRRGWVVPDPVDYVVVVDWARLDDADQAFAEWLRERGVARDSLQDEDLLIDTGRGTEGYDVRRYQVRRAIAEQR